MINELSDRFGVKIEFEAAPPKDFQSVEAQVASIENWTAKKNSMPSWFVQQGILIR